MVVADGAVDVVVAPVSAGPTGTGESPVAEVVGATVLGGPVLGGTVTGGTVVDVTVVDVTVVSVVGDTVVDGAGATETLVRSLRPYRTTRAATSAASRMTMRAVRPLRIAGFTWSLPSTGRVGYEPSLDGISVTRANQWAPREHGVRAGRNG